MTKRNIFNRFQAEMRNVTLFYGSDVINEQVFMN